MKEKSLGGSSCFKLLIADDIKITALYFMKMKSEPAECFENSKAPLEKVHMHKGNQDLIKAVRIDSQRQFTGVASLHKLAKCGIQVPTTIS